MTMLKTILRSNDQPGIRFSFLAIPILGENDTRWEVNPQPKLLALRSYASAFEREGEAMSSHVVVCLDKFRGSLSAETACDALAEGIRDSGLADEVITLPVADGGEGTIDALVRVGYQRVPVTVHDPAGKLVYANFAINHGCAVVELAQASGLNRISGRLIPLTATTFGTGEMMIRAALNYGCTTIVLAVGGCAATDGGAGMLQALGAQMMKSDGRQIDPGGRGLIELERVELAELDPRLAHAKIILASDVTNPLLGEQGAAAVYRPQKGASTQDVALLEDGLRHFSDLIRNVTGSDQSKILGAGASGGTGFAALSVLKAHPRSEIDFVLEELHMAEILKSARLAITGEGQLDEQSLQGKAPVGVAQLAASLRVPLVFVAGRVLLSRSQLDSIGAAGIYSVITEAGNIETAMTECEFFLRQIGQRIAFNHLR